MNKIMPPLAELVFSSSFPVQSWYFGFTAGRSLYRAPRFFFLLSFLFPFEGVSFDRERPARFLFFHPSFCGSPVSPTSG